MSYANCYLQCQVGQPEVNLGLITYGGSQRLLHLIGKGKGLNTLTAEIIPASTALSLGLVNYVEEIKPLRKSQSPATIATKALCHQPWDSMC